MNEKREYINWTTVCMQLWRVHWAGHILNIFEPNVTSCSTRPFHFHWQPIRIVSCFSSVTARFELLIFQWTRIFVRYFLLPHLVQTRPAMRYKYVLRLAAHQGVPEDEIRSKMTTALRGRRKSAAKCTLKKFWKAITKPNEKCTAGNRSADERSWRRWMCESHHLHAFVRRKSAKNWAQQKLVGAVGIANWPFEAESRSRQMSSVVGLMMRGPTTLWKLSSAITQSLKSARWPTSEPGIVARII